MFILSSPSSSPGVGIAAVVLNTLVCIYYGVILAYTVYYLFASFQYPLPWSNYLEDTNCTSPPQGTHYVYTLFVLLITLLHIFVCNMQHVLTMCALKKSEKKFTN